MTAPNVYSFDPQSGQLVGIGFADPDPLTPNGWLVPAHATTITPPDVPSGSVAAFRDGAWLVLKDHRGETWWMDGQSYTITALGDPATEGFSPDGPPETGQNETPVWEDDQWVIKVDRRGETWWADHDTPVLIDFLGDPADQDLVPNRPAPVVPEPEPEPEPEPVDPLSLALSKRQIIAALIEAGDMFERPELYEADAAIKAAIAQIPDPKQRALALNDWENVLTNYQREHPLFNDPAMLTAMDMTAEQVDALWTLASTLPR